MWKGMLERITSISCRKLCHTELVEGIDARFMKLSVIILFLFCIFLYMHKACEGENFYSFFL